MNFRIIATVGFLLILALIGFGGYQAYKIIVKPSTATSRPAVPAVSLNDYLTKPGSSVRLTVQGPINADENHVAQAITVSANTRTIETFNGYTSTASYTQSYPNNQAAYNDFMRALQNDGFTITKPTTNVSSTEVGLCPTGDRYIYELFDGTSSVQRLWSTSCGDRTIFKGAAGSIRELFRAQVPDYNKLPANLRLNFY